MPLRELGKKTYSLLVKNKNKNMISIPERVAVLSKIVINTTHQHHETKGNIKAHVHIQSDARYADG
jgi:hypothetical protein